MEQWPCVVALVAYLIPATATRETVPWFVQKCSAGRFSPSGDNSGGACLACFRGSYAPKQGATGCKQCPTQYYAAHTGSEACTRCTSSYKKCMQHRHAHVASVCGHSQQGRCQVCSDRQWWDASAQACRYCSMCLKTGKYKADGSCGMDGGTSNSLCVWCPSGIAIPSRI
jgi:hypothetical protein